MNKNKEKKRKQHQTGVDEMIQLKVEKENSTESEMVVEKNKKNKENDFEFKISQKELSELKEKAEDRDRIFEKLQRSVAEFENYQKRVNRDRVQWEERKLRRFLLDLLPAIDDLERIREALNGDLSLEEIRKVIKLFSEKIHKTLLNWKIKKMPTEGEDFDPNLHEALRQQETDQVEHGKILSEISGCYTMNGNVLKAAKVIVASNTISQKSDTDPDAIETTAGVVEGEALEDSRKIDNDQEKAKDPE